MSVGTYALITLAELQTFPGIPAALSAAQTTSLEGLIDAASAMMDAYCRNDLIQRSASEDYTWNEICKMGRRFELRRYPLVSVTSITDPAGNTTAATNYWMEKDAGVLWRNGSWSAPVDSNGFITYWTVVYVAGRWATTAAVPAHVKMLCKQQVASMWGRPDGGVKSTAVGDLKITYTDAEESGQNPQLLDSVKGGLGQYVRRMV